MHLIDLDLDVVRRRDTGLVELRDEDEFADHRLRVRLPRRRWSPQAEAAAEWLYDALGDGTEPFATAFRSGWRWSP